MKGEGELEESGRERRTTGKPSNNVQMYQLLNATSQSTAQSCLPVFFQCCYKSFK